MQHVQISVRNGHLLAPEIGDPALESVLWNCR